MMLRFLGIGVINTFFGISVYWLLIYAGLPYQFASLLSLILGIVFSFNSHRRVVFKTGGRFFTYVVVWIFIYFVNIEMISMIRDFTGDYIAGLVLIPVNATLSFVLMKSFVFRSGKGYGYT